ncbi:hypothetical protein ACQ4PT_059489 [Festuca glaucescens]
MAHHAPMRPAAPITATIWDRHPDIHAVPTQRAATAESIGLAPSQPKKNHSTSASPQLHPVERPPRHNFWGRCHDVRSLCSPAAATQPGAAAPASTDQSTRLPPPPTTSGPHAHPPRDEERHCPSRPEPAARPKLETGKALLQSSPASNTSCADSQLPPPPRSERTHLTMAFSLKASSSVAASSAAASSASFAASPALRGRTTSRRISFRGAAPVAAIRADASATAVAGDKRTISGTFTKLKEQGKIAFIPFIVAGDPDLATTLKALKVLDACGSDVIELGVPYSDPLADGPVIQASATRALRKGTTFEDVIAMVKEVVPDLSCPLALFTYYNPILKRGVANFMSVVKEAGVHGLVVPDVPLEETDILRSEAAKNNLELVLLTTPTTPTERMERITKASEGFVYLVSTTGVTGARADVSFKVEALLQEIKQVTDKAVAVGFGVSTPEQVKQIAGWGADGVIVGSAMVRQLGESGSPEEGLKKLEELAKNLKAAFP